MALGSLELFGALTVSVIAAAFVWVETVDEPVPTVGAFCITFILLLGFLNWVSEPGGESQTHTGTLIQQTYYSKKLYDINGANTHLLFSNGAGILLCGPWNLLRGQNYTIRFRNGNGDCNMVESVAAVPG